jgi:hypothetical protein
LKALDHYTAQDGLAIEFESVSDAGRLLVSLNQLGVELELYSMTANPVFESGLANQPRGLVPSALRPPAAGYVER